jgi:hypothetical protein
MACVLTEHMTSAENSKRNCFTKIRHNTLIMADLNVLVCFQGNHFTYYNIAVMYDCSSLTNLKKKLISGIQ